MRTIGWLLLALAAFMLVGFLGADVSGAAVVITVVLPAAGGLALVTGRLGATRRIGAHREELRRQTLEASAVARRRKSRELADGDDNLLLDTLLMDPFLLYYGVHGAALGAGAAAEALASTGAAEAMGGIAGAAGDVAGAAGEVASSIFEAIVEIIGGIFG